MEYDLLLEGQLVPDIDSSLLLLITRHYTFLWVHILKEDRRESQTNADRTDKRTVLVYIAKSQTLRTVLYGNSTHDLL